MLSMRATALRRPCDNRTDRAPERWTLHRPDEGSARIGWGSDREITFPLRIAIISDESMALRPLKLVLQGMANVDVVGTIGEADTAIDEIRRLDPDVVIVDLDLPGRSGWMLAAKFKGVHRPEIIMLSDCDRHAAQAFELEALDYLLKPWRQDRLRQAIDRARRHCMQKAAQKVLASDADGMEEATTIDVPDHLGRRRLPVSEIIWIEAARDYVFLHTSARRYIMRATMSALSARLPPTILRVHRSAFVALAHVRRWISIKGVPALVLSNHAKLPVGRTYLEEVRTALRALQG